jgi:K(+)-stimulated pyrophosphate-energized sodium pump
MTSLAYIPLGAGIAAILFALYLVRSVLKEDKGTRRMQEISRAIQEGAMAFLKREFKTMAIAGVALFLFLTFVLGAIRMGGGTGYEVTWQMGVGFLFGAVFSALAGFIGMSLTTRANTRVANKAKEGMPKALALAFRTGAVTGMFVAGLALFGLSIFYIWFQDPRLMIGFAFGACLMSLFARIGGGIYTKAADLGADLVGKVEAGIPEDDPRNPAVIADQVGDNVGDCAGMGADLFETYAVTGIGAMLLGWFLFGESVPHMIYPLLLGAAGILAAMVGVFFVRVKAGQGIMTGIYKGVLAAAIIAAICFIFVTKFYIGDHHTFLAGFGLFGSAMMGLIIAAALFAITEYFTSKKYNPVKSIAYASQTGPATNVVTGLSVGLMSPAIPALVICGGILTAFAFAGGGSFFSDPSLSNPALYSGLYGIGIAVMGMISLTGVIIATDSYGPVTDNAGGIAEMADLDPKTREVTDALDAVGNTTKAVTKAFAIGSAALAAITLFIAYLFEAFGGVGPLEMFTIWDPLVLIGLFIGGLIPFAFSSRCMRSVGEAGGKIVEEVRRQFREIKGIMDGTGRPEYAKCVDIVTKDAIRGMIFPVVLAVASPIAVGFILGPRALGGLLMGCIITGLFLALQMATGGAAWDNAKKYIEDGNLGGKKSPAHAAAVVGDTVGDPCKDTAGPAINPLIKVMNTVAIIFAITIAAHHALGI